MSSKQSSSRKSSSRKSSSRKSSLFKNEVKNLEVSIDTNHHIDPAHMILFTIVGISYNLLDIKVIYIYIHLQSLD